MARVAGLAVLCGLVLSVPLEGHHSFAAYYFEDRSMTIEGDVVEFDYRNPHAWVHVLTVDTSGRPQKYAAEWGNPRRLSERGVTKDTVRPGDRVVVTGSPSREASDFKLHLKHIERPADGWKWVGRAARR